MEIMNVFGCSLVAMATVFCLGVALCHSLDKEFAIENSAERDIAVACHGYKMAAKQTLEAINFFWMIMKNIIHDEDGERWHGE